MRRSGILLAAVTLTILGAALVRGQEARADDTAIVRLAVEGRTNATPSVAARGAFAAVAWSATASGSGDVFLAVSRDGGLSFGQPVQVNDQRGEARNGGEMPPRVALVAASDSAADPDIVVVWRARTPATSIRYARSRDGGRTFSPATSLQSPQAAGERGWQTATVDAAGRIHAVWLDHRGLASGSQGGAAGHSHHDASAVDGAAMALRSALYYTSVDTAGAAPAPERELAKGVCYCCKTALAAGPDGAVYAAWRHVYAGNIRDIAFLSSRDGGRTFGEASRVSEDRWQLAGCPDDGPAMAIDGDGVAHIVWPTVIGGDTPQGALFYAAMRDGERFGARVRVSTLGSPRPTHPQLTLVAGNRLAVAWDETLGGVRRSIVSIATVAAGAPPAFAAPVVLDASPAPSASAYPALTATSAHVVAAWTSGAAETSAIAVRRLPIATANGSR